MAQCSLVFLVLGGSEKCHFHPEGPFILKQTPTSQPTLSMAGWMMSDQMMPFQAIKDSLCLGVCAENFKVSEASVS